LVSGSNPTLTLVRGIEYTFSIDASGHPFWIKTAPGSGTNNAYNDGVTNNGDDSGVITFTPTLDAPNILYYNCELHSVMGGTINVIDEIIIPAEIKFIGDTKIEGNLTASMYSGSGRGLFDIPIAAISGDTVRIASGSVTASVSPDYGLVVITPFTSSFGEDGSFTASIASQFTGSVSISGSLFVNDISGGLFIESSSFVYAEGQFLRNIPRSALTEDALISTEIKSGSVTASVAPDYGFRVITDSTSSIDELGVYTTQIGSRFTGSVDISGSLFKVQ